MLKVADAHCDTLLAHSDNPFHTEKAHWNLDKFKYVNGVLQYMAVCILPPHHGDTAFSHAATALGNFWKNLNEEINPLLRADDFDEEKINIVLVLEGASPIVDDIRKLYAFHRLGVRAITLTWNHRNYIADGIGVGGSYGLTDFGKEAIGEMEKLGIIIDVSHLNEAGFKDLCEIAKKPFTASHSNAWEIHNHDRNLKDYQIKEIFERNGFIGLNFYTPFICDSKEYSEQIAMFLSHIEYYLQLGGEDNIGMGADFDGMDESPFSDVCAYEIVYQMLKEIGLDEDIIEKIMFRNLIDFTKRTLL